MKHKAVLFVDRMYNYRMDTDDGRAPCGRYFEKPVAPDKLLAELEGLVG